jgi:putative membrane protein
MKTMFVRKKVCVALVAGAIALPALFVTSRQLQADSKMTMAAKTSKMSGVPASDKEFMKEAAQGGMAEVMMGQLAAKKGANSEVKKFGQRMVTDHSKANAQLKALAAKKKVTLPKDVGPKHKAHYKHLSSLSGAAFDRAYMQHMVNDHVEDVAAFQKEATGGKEAEVKAWAAKTLPVLKTHLSIAKSVNAKLK